MGRYVSNQGVALECGCHASIRVVTEEGETYADGGKIQMECPKHHAAVRSHGGSD